VLAEQLFSPTAPPDHLNRRAGQEQGAASILIGVAANESIATRQPVDIASLATLNPAATKLSELT